MPFKNICIEVREQLHCINVFLQFDEEVENAASLLRISVKPDRLCLHSNEKQVEISLEQYFKLEVDTLSGLVVEHHNACFRLRIENLQKFPSASKPQHIVPVLNAILNENLEQTVAIVCSNCKCQLNEGEHKFKRYREFPSGGVDLDELFCHNAPKFEDKLVPQNTDLFYGYEFIVLNKQLLKNSCREKSEQIYCSRCLQHLGENILENRAVKLWTNGLKLRLANNFTSILENNNNMKATAHFLYKVMRDCCLMEEQRSCWLSKAMANVKVLLNTTSTDCVRHHLLLHILEQQLPVLLSENKDLLKLKQFFSFKLLYRHIPEDEAVKSKNKHLLSSWQQDISIQCLHISPKLFLNLLEEMQRNALLLPETYRYTNGDDDFELSYIFY